MQKRFLREFQTDPHTPFTIARTRDKFQGRWNCSKYLKSAFGKTAVINRRNLVENSVENSRKSVPQAVRELGL